MRQQLPLTPSREVYQSLIYACSMRKDFYLQCLNLVKEMESLGYSSSIHTYNYILSSCAKVGNLQTAHQVWKKLTALSKIQKSFAPDEYSYTHMFWLLASIETKDNKKSSRDFHYQLSSDSVVKEAQRLYSELQTNGIVFSSTHLLTAYLATHCTHLKKALAEKIFYEDFAHHQLQPHAISYQHLFEMYDTLHDYEGMKRLKRTSQEQNMSLSFKSWRAMVRTAAWTGHLDEAVDFVADMKAAGHAPILEELKLVSFRCSELENAIAHERFLALCDTSVNHHTSKWNAWHERTRRVLALLDQVYGKPAGKGFLRGVYANMKGPGPDFKTDTNPLESEFKQVESEFPKAKKVGRTSPKEKTVLLIADRKKKKSHYKKQ